MAAAPRARSAFVVPAWQYPGITLSTVRRGAVTTVTAVSRLSGRVFYHWYVDGAYLGGSAGNVKTFTLEVGEQVRVEVIDTNDPDFDGVAGAPDGYPARRTIRWVRSIDPQIVAIRVIQQEVGEADLTLAEIPLVGDRWSYELLSPRLDDLGEYGWITRTIDRAGNIGSITAAVLEGALFQAPVVRRPDAPEFTVSFDAGTAKINFASV